ncbi:GMC oxidoreductase 9 [Mycena venus]|uniref:GMC oxidoreductase 9 n=1 Tax=Mycena venus TaxID=2733690 RepID=A0A8H6X674_9AGAR|nr:GMC oxidoreductase 9 [Mycena venus]
MTSGATLALKMPAGGLMCHFAMTYINTKGSRVSNQSAYITPEVMKRKNLSVLTHDASVTKIIFEASPDSRYEPARKSFFVLVPYTLPQTLMLSGIGPADQLRRHGIAVVVDLAGVGAHIMDHPAVDVALEETSGHSLSYLVPQSVLETIKMMFAVGHPDLMNSTIEDATSGSGSPDLELAVSPSGYFYHGRAKLPNKPSLGLHLVLLRPKSSGTVQIRSSNPFDPPVINPNYLSSANDLFVLLRGMRMVTRAANTIPLARVIRDKDHRDPGFSPDLATASDPVLAEYIRLKLESLYYPTSTARMARPQVGGVVDSHLCVHGVKSLRVVDASIFPTIPSGHTAAPTIAVAEMAADIIREAHVEQN